jgi:ribosomal-protein-alanine N-acetyltransferase
MDTERTLLTLLEEVDLPDMMEMAREPDTFRYLKFLQVMTDEEYGRFLQGKLEEIRTKNGYHWAVRLKTNGAFIGAVNLNPIKGTPLLQIGCQLKRACWRQGFASELMQRLLIFAVDDLRLTEVYGVFEKDNLISRRLLKKLGFIWQETKQGSPETEIEIHKYIPPPPSTAPSSNL